jgi:hypothetical protein
MKKSTSTEFLVTSLSMVLVISGCASAPTPAPLDPSQTEVASNTSNAPGENLPLPAVGQYTMDEVEALAGFDVKEPAYLPAGVFFEYAAYQGSPSSRVTLHFKLVHETYGDMGVFFQIVQEPQAEALPNPTACGESGNECETVQIGDLVVNYRLTDPTESLMWVADGFSFQLLRTAGEPNKIYRDELLKVAHSMK